MVSRTRSWLIARLRGNAELRIERNPSGSVTGASVASRPSTTTPVPSGTSAIPGTTRRTPSRRSPAREATRRERMLRGSTSASRRFNPSSLKA